MWINFIGPLGFGEALLLLLFTIMPIVIIVIIVLLLVKVFSISKTIDEINRKLDERR